MSFFLKDKFTKEAQADAERIERDYNPADGCGYAGQAGAFMASAKHYAAQADRQREELLKLKDDPAAWVTQFLGSYPDLKDVMRLLEAIHDVMIEKRYDGSIALDLSDVLADLDDFISEYEAAPEREAERLAEIAERRREERRDADLERSPT